MLKGLRKRETYEDLINELGEDPIKKYPDRRASDIENSNYLSQLALGFQEVAAQNDRILKEKTKELLIQDMASQAGVSHHTFKSLSSLGMSGLLSGPARPGFIPSRAPSPQEFNIGSPRSHHSAQRQFREQLFGPDLEPEVLLRSLQNQMDIDDDAKRQEERQQQIVTQFRHYHEGVNTTINRMMPPQPDINMESIKDIMENNPFEGIYTSGSSSSNQIPVKTLIEQIEKKEEKKEEMKDEKKEDHKKRGRPNKLSKPNDEPDDKPEITQGRASSRTKRTAVIPPIGRPEPKRKTSNEKDSDDEPELINVKLNRNTSINFWAQQTPNEIRAQLRLRNIPTNDYAFLKKPQLIEFVRNLIKNNKNW